MLTSPRLALTILLVISVYTGSASWFPWVRGAAAPPAWAQSVGLDHPFTAIPFLLLIVLLFVSTAACTLKRLGFSRALFAGCTGRVGRNMPLVSLNPEWESTLRAQGYRRFGNVFYRHRAAFFAGPLLHVGLLVVLAGVTVQQGFQDSGSFELAEGELIRLDAPQGLMSRHRGLFAPEAAPSMEIGLDSFDAFYHQAGYAPDRLSKLSIRDYDSSPERQAELDRAHGVKVGSAEIYQAIPTGLALKVEIAGLGLRLLHLREMSPRSSAGEFTAPGGEKVRFVVETERSLYDPQGTGQVRVRLEAPYQAAIIGKGVPFLFGTEPAKILAIVRWAGFTYSRSPGIGVIFSGFAVILLGSLLLLFTAGVATVSPGPGGAMTLYQNRGQKELETLLLREEPSLEAA